MFLTLRAQEYFGQLGAQTFAARLYLGRHITNVIAYSSNSMIKPEILQKG